MRLARRHTPDPRQLGLVSRPARPQWASADLPEARAFGGEAVTLVPLTPELAEQFRRALGDVLDALRNADSYEAANHARRRLAVLKRTYKAHTGQALTIGLTAVGLSLSKAMQYAMSTTIPPEAWSNLPLEVLDPTLPPDRAAREAFARFQRSRGSWLRTAARVAQMPLLALANIAAVYQRMPLVLHVPRLERVEVEGVPVGVWPMPEASAREALAALREALRILRTQRRVPWLTARMPPLALTLECGVGNITFAGAYDPPSGTIDLCAWVVASTPALMVAKTIAHEMGHHVWRTSLSGAAKLEWARLLRDARGTFISDYASRAVATGSRGVARGRRVVLRGVGAPGGLRPTYGAARGAAMAPCGRADGAAEGERRSRP